LRRTTCLYNLEDGLLVVLKSNLKKKKKLKKKPLETLNPLQNKTFHEDNYHFLIKKLFTTGGSNYAE